MVLTGSAVAAGLLWLAWLIVPHRPDPVVALGRIDAAQRAENDVPAAAVGRPLGWLAGVRRRLGERTAAALTGRGIARTSLRADLGLLGRSYEAHLGTQVLAGMFGAVLVAAVAAGLSVAGIGPPLPVPAVLLIVVAGVFALLPEVDVRRAAAAHRRTFRHALGSFLDLVSMSMAGGRGLDEALISSARTGTGWPFALLAGTLQRARDIGTRPWAALRDLGQRIGVDELRDLAGSVELVAGSGSRIRTTLAARASTLRRRNISETEGRASEREQSLRIAQLLIGLGFVVFIGYPAVATVMSV